MQVNSLAPPRYGKGGSDMDTGLDLEQLLEEGNQIRVKPQGYSMYPLLVPGRDEVIIKQEDSSRLRRGDIVLFRREGSILVLHRICRRCGDDFFMVGDNQKQIEGPIGKNQIKGKVTTVIRGGRTISVENRLYRLYSCLWLWLRPLRPMLSKMVHYLKTLFRGKKKPEI